MTQIKIKYNSLPPAQVTLDGQPFITTSNGTTTNITLQDEDGNPVNPVGSDGAIILVPNPDDADVTVNSNQFGAVESGDTIDVPVVNSENIPVGIIDDGAVMVGNSDLSVNGEPVGEVVAEGSKNIVVELDGTPSGTWNPSTQAWEIDSLPCPDANITLAGEPFISAPSGGSADITIINNNGVSIEPVGSFNSQIIIPDFSEWQRPSDWLPVPVIDPAEQVFYGLFAVYNVAVGNRVAMQFSGNYTVDWGDGTVENFGSGITASRQYPFDSAPANTLTSEGFRQVYIKVTPQAGQVLTQINLDRNHPNLPVNKTSQFLDFHIQASSCTTLRFGQTNNVIHRRVKYVNIIQTGALNPTQHFNMFSNFNQLEKIEFFDISMIGNFANFFNSCFMLKTIPQLDVSAGTDFTSFFSSCRDLRFVPDLNTASATNFTQMFSQCGSLLRVPNLVYTNVTGASSMLSGCTSLQTINIITNNLVINTSQMINGSTNLVDVLIQAPNTSSTATFFGTATNIQRLRMPGLRRGILANSLMLSATAINEFFTSLGMANGAQTINVSGNPGASTCNPSIAQAKGFAVITV